MTRNELKDLIKDIIREECLIETSNKSIQESVKVGEPDKYGNSVTNLKINGISIEISNKSGSTKEDNQRLADEHLEKDFKILKSNFSSISKKVKNMIEEQCEDWDEDKSNVKYAHFDSISYAYFERAGVSYFTLWWNSKYNKDRNKLLGGHSISIEVKIKDGELKIDNGIQLNG